MRDFHALPYSRAIVPTPPASRQLPAKPNELLTKPSQKRYCHSVINTVGASRQFRAESLFSLEKQAHNFVTQAVSLRRRRANS